MASRSFYQIVIRHPGLHKQRVIRGNDRYIVEAAAQAQSRVWNEQFAKKLASEERRRDREARQQELEDNLSEAEERTSEAEAELEAVRGVLAATLRVDDRIDWEKLKQHQPFSQPQPQQRPYLPIPPEPHESEARFKPQLGLLDKLWSGSAQKKEEAARALFAAEHAAWVKRVAAIEGSNNAIYASNLRECEEWKQRRDGFEAAREAHNAAVERRRTAYQALDPEAISDYCDMVLAASRYPDFCPQQFEIGYHAGSKCVVVEYELPAPDDVPRLAEVKFIRSKGEFTETELIRKQFETLYGDLLCQIALRTVHELFEADVVRALESVVFNGNVTAVDPASGHIKTRCVLTLRAERPAFLAVNLRNVDAQACFRGMGGIGGAKILDLKAVQPVSAIDRTGERFTSAEDLSESGASPLDEWQGIAKTLTDPQDVRFIAAGTLAAILGFPATDKYSAPMSRELANAVGARALGIEPDARHGGAPYRANDEVGLFRPLGGEVTDAYAGAAGLLQLCVMIAAADEHPTEAELEVARDFIRRSVALNRAEQHRLLVLESALCRQPELIKRSLARVAKRLDAAQRQLVGEVLVCIAGADGKISSTEWSALDRACKTLELPPSALEGILRQLGAELQEVTVQEAESGEPGEALPSAVRAPPAAPAFTLDMNRVAQISQETTEVVGMLAAVMREEELPRSGRNPSAPVRTIAPDEGVPHFAALDPKYRPLVQRLAERETWSRREFDQLAGEFNLMPLGAFDALNEWSDEHLGDFLLEGNDPITFHRILLSKATQS
jgi:restriction system protein